MYLPNHFAERRPEVLRALMRAHPLATLAWIGPDGLAAEHLPLAWVADPDPEGLGSLRGHVARANPMWQQADPDREVLAVFQGPQVYVSPGWYPSKQEHGRVVPTWNYAVVHVRGPLVLHHDPAWLHALVSGLTDRHEQDRAQPWAVSDAPPEYIEGLTRAIVGIEIPLRSLSGKWKVSQNREVRDRAGVADALAASTDPQRQAMAGLVAQTLPDRAD